MANDKHLLDRFPDLLRRCHEARFEVDADSGLFTIDEKHADGVRQLLTDVVVLLVDIEREYAAGHRDDGGEVTLVDCSIADLSFLGKLELEEVIGRLAEARQKKRVWDVLRYADMGGARAEQAMMALEASIREAEGLGAEDRDDLDLGPALEVRRQYALLRDELIYAEGLRGGDLKGALEILHSKISDLRSHETYAQVRVDDRLQIRGLQKRIFAALDDRGGEDLERLWQDIDAAIDLLLQINRRPVLEDHDRRLLAALGTQVESTRFLSSLLGRSLELDGILLGRRVAEPEELHGLLDDLRNSLLD